jgi:sRNA-binding regulator protein Hfq
MKTFLVALAISISTMAFSQADKLYLHNGKTVEGSVVRNTEFTVIYKYVNEDAEQTISKYAVEKIVYGKSGRTETVSPKITINSEDDWANVMILEDNAASAGLTKIGEIRGKTSLINYRTAAGSDKKAEEKLKKEAAKQGCQFVIMTSDKDAGLQSNGSRSWGGIQSIKKGIGYKY